MAKNQEILLRSWQMESNYDVTFDELKSAIEELIKGIDAKIAVDYSSQLGQKSIALFQGQYMPVHFYFTREKGINYIVTSVIGKGNQVKATDLEKFYYKAVGSLSTFLYATDKGIGIAKTIKSISAVHGIAGGVGAATGLAIRGTFKLAAKGLRVLMRDKEAWDNEMAHYQLCMSISDFVIGGADTSNIISRLTVQAEKHNNYLAQYILGCAYIEGRGVTPNEKTSFSWFEAAAENGHLESQNIVSGEYLYGEKEYTPEQKEKGIQYLKNIADTGEEWPVELLMDIYAVGSVKGISTDYKIAVNLAELYAERGSRLAMLRLAEFLDPLIAKSIPELKVYTDISRAEFLYRAILKDEKSDEHKAEAAMNLAGLYEEGFLKESAAGQLMSLYEDASSYGNVKAKAILAEAYANGDGIEKDEVKAVALCQEILRSDEKEYHPDAYYWKHISADRAGSYNESMENARHFLSCEDADEDTKAELQRYLDEKNLQMQSMSEDERRAFLGLPPKSKVNGKLIGIIIGICAAIGIIIAIIAGLSGSGDDYDYDDDTSQNSVHSYENDDSDSQGSDIVYPDPVMVYAEASSELEPYQDITYSPYNVDDDDINTCWSEGVEGDGIGEWIQLSYDTDEPIEALSICNGYAKSEDLYTSNNRVKDASIEFADGTIETFTLEDDMYVDQIVEFSEPKDCSTIKITIESVYEGDDYADTCLSEVGPFDLDVLNQVMDGFVEIQASPEGSDSDMESGESEADSDSTYLGNETDAIEYAYNYYVDNIQADYDENFTVSCEGSEEGCYYIKGYDDMEDHIATLFQWDVYEDGSIFDEMSGEWLK